MEQNSADNRNDNLSKMRKPILDIIEHHLNLYSDTKYENRNEISSKNIISFSKTPYSSLLSASTSNFSNKVSKSRKNELHSVSNVHITISTQDKCKLSEWGLPKIIYEKYEKKGVKVMFPWQVECLANQNILEDNKNLVYSAPTSAGKTLVSEILMLKSVLEQRKKAIFILPFVSVVREKMFYFQDLLSESGLRVEGFMGSVTPRRGFSCVNIAIATIEKANSLINRLMEEGELDTLGIIVIDELHLLGDPSRGYLLELLLTKVKYAQLKLENVRIQIVGMSATLPNLSSLAKWLDAELYKTDFRPIPLAEHCKLGNTIYDKELTPVRTLSTIPELADDVDDIFQLCLETIKDGYGILIFCPTKNWCEKLALQIAGIFVKLGLSNSSYGIILREKLDTSLIKETLEQLKRCPIGLDSTLKNTVSFGVAFHHAGLTMDERDIIEGAFRTGSLKVLTATSTLSSGVNLPARRVIIRSPIFNRQVLDPLVYTQMIGRAGRMGRDTAGESILICKSNEQSAAKTLLSGTLEEIESCLEGSGRLLRTLLEAIASQVVRTTDDVQLYLGCTFAVSCDEENLKDCVSEAIKFLMMNEFITLRHVEDNSKAPVFLEATSLGKACLAAAITPRDGLYLFEELQKARRCIALDTELHILYLVTPYDSGSQINQIDWINYMDIWRSLEDCERRVGALVGIEERFLISAVKGKILQGKQLNVHRRFYTALALYDLVHEAPLNAVCKKYNCCRGLLQSLQQSSATLAGMVTQFCKELGWGCMEVLVSQFQARLQFGVCRDLLDLLRLPSLNGIRARSLYKEGIKSVVDLASANERDVERALHKAIPFESVRDNFEDDLNDDQVAEKRKLKSIFITGRDGLTAQQAAAILIEEARDLIQNELGVKDVKWQNQENDAAKVLSITVSTPKNQSSTVISPDHRDSLYNKTNSRSNLQSENIVRANQSPNQNVISPSVISSNQNGIDNNLSKQSSVVSMDQDLFNSPLESSKKANFERQSIYSQDQDMFSDSNTLSKEKSPSEVPQNETKEVDTNSKIESFLNGLPSEFMNSLNEPSKSLQKKIPKNVDTIDQFMEEIPTIVGIRNSVSNSNKQGNKITSFGSTWLQDISIPKHSLKSNINLQNDELKKNDKLKEETDRTLPSNSNTKKYNKITSFGSTWLEDISIPKNCLQNGEHVSTEKLKAKNDGILLLNEKRHINVTSFGSTWNFSKLSNLGESVQVQCNKTDLNKSPYKKADNNLERESDLFKPPQEASLKEKSRRSSSLFGADSLMDAAMCEILEQNVLEDDAEKQNASSMNVNKATDSSNKKITSDKQNVKSLLEKLVLPSSWIDESCFSPFEENRIENVETEDIKKQSDKKFKIETKIDDTEGKSSLKRKLSSATVANDENVTISQMSWHDSWESSIKKPRVSLHDQENLFTTAVESPKNLANLLELSNSFNNDSSSLKTGKSSKVKRKLLIDLSDEVASPTTKDKSGSNQNKRTPLGTIDNLNTEEVVVLNCLFPETQPNESLSKNVESVVQLRLKNEVDSIGGSLLASTRKSIYMKTDEEQSEEDFNFETMNVIKLESSKSAFKLFKSEMEGQKEISIALACESSQTNSIGRKIIGNENNAKSRRSGNYVHENKRICGVAISWGLSATYFMSLLKSSDDKVTIKDRITCLKKILQYPSIKVHCFASKDVYKTLHQCIEITPMCHFIDPKVANWLLNPDLIEKSFHMTVTEHFPKGKNILKDCEPTCSTVSPGFNVHSSISPYNRAVGEALLTWYTSKSLHTKLLNKNPALVKTFEDIEMKVSSILARMELRGFGLNVIALRELAIIMQKEMSFLEQEAYTLAGRPFKFNSSKDVSQVLDLAKKGKVSTSRAVLEKCNHPIAKYIISWRKLSTTEAKVIIPLLNIVDNDSRVRGNCITHTVTGRISMHEPNIQGVPKDFTSYDESKIFSLRTAFVPNENNVLLSADFCQLELRIMAHFSKDNELCKAICKNSEDIFKSISAVWNRVPINEVDENMRNRTKQLCYGMIYGMGIRTLAETLKITETEATEFLENFMNTFKGIKKWLGYVVEKARSKGYITTIMGRRRMLPGLYSKNQLEKSQAERQAVNTKVQGSGADIAKKAMVIIDKKLRKTFFDADIVFPGLYDARNLRSSVSQCRGGYLVLHLHDELLYEVKADDLNVTARIVKESMENACKLDVPLPVKVKVGPTWGDLVEYDEF